VVKVEACRGVSGDLARREIFDVVGVDNPGSGDSGVVEGDDESVTGESTTAEEVIPIIEGEAGSGGVLRVGATPEGSTIAAEAVKVGFECLRRKGKIDTTKMRRSRLEANVRISLCRRGRLHQEILAR